MGTELQNLKEGGDKLKLDIVQKNRRKILRGKDYSGWESGGGDRVTESQRGG